MLRAVCDVAYVLQVEALTAQMSAVAAALVPGGAADVLNLPGEIRARFDAELAAAVDARGDASLESLRRELGV